MMTSRTSRSKSSTAGILSGENIRIILLLLVVFLVLRMGIAIFYGQRDFEGIDSIGYYHYAQAVLKNSDWLAHPDFDGHFRAPGYPLFVAAVYALFGTNSHTAVYLFQAFLSVLTCWLIYKLSQRIIGQKVALLSFVWSGLYVFYLYYTAFLLRETLVIFLMIAFMYFLYLYLADGVKKARHFWLFSGLYALLVHTDARYLFYLPFLALLFIIYRPFFKGMKQYGIFLAAFILLLVPWTVRNYIAYDGFVLVNIRTLDLRSKDTRMPKSLSRLSDHILNFKPITETNREIYPTEAERQLIKQGRNPGGRTAEEIKAIRNDVYPASGFLERKIFWLVELWRPVRLSSYYTPFPDAKFEPRWSLLHNLSSLLCYGILLPFMVAGIFFLIRKRLRAFIFLFLPVFLQTSLHVLHCGVWRYRVPVDAFILILAFYGLGELWEVFKKRSLKQHASNS